VSNESADPEMTGAPLKVLTGYVFVKLETQLIKHQFAGERPTHGDFTICGQKIVGRYQWAERALALGKMPYCRECERIWSQS
jgi:uncharacterized protein YifE (UPF0438 family)